MTLVHVSDAVYDLADAMEITTMEAEDLMIRFLDDDDELAGLDVEE
jgi:hypothetical protein